MIIIETWWDSNNNKNIKFNKKWLPPGFELLKLCDAIKLSNNPQGRLSSGIWIIAKKSIAKYFGQIAGNNPYFGSIYHYKSNIIISGVYIPSSQYKNYKLCKKI